MDILMLGGTAFLGRAIAENLVARQHAVTCLARGTAPAPSGVTLVRANRDDEQGLAEVSHQTWDAVIDVSRQPGQVRRAVRDLKTDQFIFVSSASVYATGEPDRDESAPIVEPLRGDVMESMEHYGPAKVACEQSVLSLGPAASVLRVGLIGGPGDTSGRSGYWPWRFAHPVGDRVVVPDDDACPCALIDVRDLATWIATAAEDGISGIYNVTGETTTLGTVLRLSQHVADSTAEMMKVPASALAALGVNPWLGPNSMPLWIDDPAMQGFSTLNCARARKAGLTTRPLAETLRATLHWEEQRDEERGCGLTDELERTILKRAQWREWSDISQVFDGKVDGSWDEVRDAFE